jgi:hypothetical protein
VPVPVDEDEERFKQPDVELLPERSMTKGLLKEVPGEWGSEPILIH